MYLFQRRLYCAFERSGGGGRKVKKQIKMNVGCCRECPFRRRPAPHSNYCEHHSLEIHPFLFDLSIIPYFCPLPNIEEEK